MASTAMLWGGASYNNGILPFKRYILGEAYTRDGQPASVTNPVPPTAAMTQQGILPPTVSVAGLGDRAAGRYLPRLRTRRSQHRQSVSRDRRAG